MTHADPAQPVPTPLPPADVLLVTVTEVETRAVFAALQATAGRAPTHHSIAAHHYYHLGVIAGAQVWLVRSEMGTATVGGAFPTITNAIAALQPHAIIMVGIAFGMDAPQLRLGDVLVSHQLLLYDLQRVGTVAGELVLQPRGDRTTVAPLLLGRFRHGALDWSPPTPTATRSPTVHVGLLLSGDKLIDHQGFRDQLRHLAPKALGGEMEGAGLYLAASAAKVDWIVVKAICDWADGHKGRNKRARQQQAAANAAAFTFHVLGQGGFGPTARRPRNDAATILAQLQALLRPTPAPYRATVTRMVEEYAAIFGGRDAELAVLDQWLTEDTRPFAFLHAPTGRGKTALLIHWVARVQARGGWTVVFVPISLRFQTATEMRTLGALGVALAAFHQDQDFTTYNQSPDQLRPLIADYLRREPPAGQRLLLVLDGLDEAIGWHIGRELFPYTPGPHLRVVASAREKAQTTRADWYEQLGWEVAQTCDLALDGLNQAAVRDVLVRLGNSLDQLATDVDLLAEIARVSGGDPLTIHFLVKALQDGSLTPGQLVGLPQGLEARVKDWLDELRRHSHQVKAVYALVSLCAIALGPLTSADLAELAPTGLARGVDVQVAVEHVARYLIGDGSAEHGYVFSHPRLRELFLEGVLTAKDRADEQARFVAYGSAWYAYRCTPVPDYLRLFWVQHLTDAGQWDQLRQVLTEVVPSGMGWVQPWASTRYAAEGSYTGYLSDLAGLWDQSDHHEEISTALRCALITSTVGGLSANLTPELLVALMTVGTPEGRWSVQAVLETITHMPASSQRRAALLALLHDGTSVPPTAILTVVQAEQDAACRAELLTVLADQLSVTERTRVRAQAFAAAQDVPEADQRARLLLALAEMLPLGEKSMVLAQAHTAAMDVSNAARQVSLLRALADQLPLVERAAILAQAHQAVLAVPDVAHQIELRTDLIDTISAAEHDTMLPQMIATAQTVRDTGKQAELLIALAARIPNDNDLRGVVAQAREIIQALPEAGKRASLLVKLAACLPPAEQHAVFAQAYAIINTEPETWRRATLLIDVLARVPAQMQSAACTEALIAIRAVPVAETRAHLLTQLADYLPAPARAAVLDQALEAAQAVPDPWLRAVRLTRIVGRLPAATQCAVIAQAVAATQTLCDVEQQARLLTALADTLLATAQALVLTQTQVVALSVPDTQRRAWRLLALVDVLPVAERATVLAQTLELTQSMPVGWQQAQLLTTLVPYLPVVEQPTILAQALAAAQAEPEAALRNLVLERLAAYVPHAMLRLAQTETEAAVRAPLLIALIDHPSVADQAAVRTQAHQAIQAVPEAETQTRLLTALADRLPTTDQAVVHTQALTAIQAVPEVWQRVQLLTALADKLPADTRAEVLDQALAAAWTVPEVWRRAELLIALADKLPADTRAEVLDQALVVAQAVPEVRRRAQLLTALIDRLPVADQSAVLIQALTVVQVVSDSWRMHLLTALAPHLARHAPRADFLRTLRVLAARGRPDLLSDLAALVPWIVAITTEAERAEIAQAIIDVGRCWP